MLVPNRRKSGFTLIEVLVASAVSVLLGLLVLKIFAQSRASIDQATGRIEMLQTARIPAERIAFYLSSSVGIPGEESILYPTTHEAGNGTKSNHFGGVIYDDDPKTWDRVVVFRTTEDFMDASFNPESIMDINDIRNNLETWERDDQRLTEYVVWYEDDTVINWLPNASNCIAIARLNNSAVSAERDENWVKNWLASPDPANQFTGGIQPRILARHVTDARFRRKLQSGVEVTVQVTKDIRQALGGHQTKTFQYDITAPIPSNYFNS